MSQVVDQDRKMLDSMPKDKLLDLFFSHIRNLWRVDGLYFLGIEKKFGTDAATEIDANCWRLMGKLEARALKKTLGIYRVAKCRTQLTRIRKGLGEFPCKKVRFGYLKSFAEEMNQNVEVNCKICPPGEHPQDIWCEWEFKLKKDKT
jgi:hypothetical protein